MKKHPMIARISEMRRARAQLSGKLNDFYTLMIPERPLIGNVAPRRAPDTARQDDIFDQTGQQAVVDFAADQVDYFVPDYKPWVKLKPGTALGDRDQRLFDDQIGPWEETLYDLIRQTNFHENQDEIFKDVAGAAAGIILPYAPPSRPVRCIPVMMAGLLFDEGAFMDVDARLYESNMAVRHLSQMFPGINFSKALKSKARNENAVARIIQGCYPEWGDNGVTWKWIILCDDEVVEDRKLPADAPPPMSVARWRHSPPSAWGPGPADLAMAPARTLDELSYLNLKKLGKEADMPFSYENDGVTNPEKGIDAGDWVPRRVGSQPPSPLFNPTSSQNIYFDREDLRMQVRRALYQDGPYQRGDTPPTATQWLSEEAKQQRRQARRRIYREYVLPVLQRFAYVFTMRGELEPIKIGGQGVAVEFVNPLSKASDVEEASAGMQLAQGAVSIFGETAVASIDAFKTMTNWQEKMGDKTLVLKEPNDQDDLVKQIFGGGRNVT